MIMRERVPCRIPVGGCLAIGLLLLIALPSWSQGQKTDDPPKPQEGKYYYVPVTEPGSPGFDPGKPWPYELDSIWQTDTTGTPVWAPEDNAMIPGVAETTYEIDELAAGMYTYNCLAHPATMVGTLEVA